MQIISLSRDEVITLAEMATRADANSTEFLIAAPHGNGVAFKVGGGMWTAPMGKIE